MASHVLVDDKRDLQSETYVADTLCSTILVEV